MKDTPAESHRHQRYWRPFDIEWLSTHPLFLGYMEDDSEEGLESRQLSIEYPYKSTLLEILQKDALKFAPYRATLVNSIVDGEPGMTLRFWYGVQLTQ
jgi:hypothetical protein